MADYIYLLQHRLTPSQQAALQHVREAARNHGATVFLVGGAVRDLTSGSPVRDLDVAVQGNPARFKKELQKAGGTLIGENPATQSIFFTFPGGARLEVGATLSASWPRPGKPVYKPATILDDLRRRDFTANAMAISLNEGSFGLLMDPLNGVADLENRELRLVSNYGFIEEPVRMIRAQRLSARLGWHLEEKTQQRYETGKAEDYIAPLSVFDRGYELEEIFHEDDPLRVLHRLESEGWMKVLYPGWTAAKPNESELNKLRDIVGQLELVGIVADPSAIQFPLLTAKLPPKDVAAIKKLFARPGFVDQIAAVEPSTREFATLFSGKTAALPSDAYKMLYASSPEVVLSLAYSSKSAPVQARYNAFFNESSQARTKIPYQMMQEMRITPDLPGYDELIEKLHFAIMDGKLDTPEATKAFLEPYSPPAPPPPVQLRRRPAKREAKASKAKAKKSQPDAAAAAAAESVPQAEGEAAPAPAAKKAAEPKKVQEPRKVQEPKKTQEPKAAKPAPAKKEVPAKVAAKPAAKAAAKAPAKKAAPATAAKTVAKKAPAKAAKPAVKKIVAKKAAPAKKSVAKTQKKAAPAKKAAAKKSSPKKAPAKKAPAKKVAKKTSRR